VSCEHLASLVHLEEVSLPSKPSNSRFNQIHLKIEPRNDNWHRAHI
jgi:hypothetical protein